METNTLLIFVLTGIVSVILIIFLIRANNRDKKSLNPDSDNLIDEIQADHERNRDKI